MRETCRIRVRPISGAAIPGGGGRDAVTVNISGGGVCFTSPDRHVVGDFLAVEMQMPEFSSPVVAMGRVAWVGGAQPPCEVGVEFWWVGWGDDSAQRAISDFIKSELRQGK
jgi:Tfp pilus assembly protein PilZ